MTLSIPSSADVVPRDPPVLSVAHPTGAVEIWLNRPERLNALGVETVDLLRRAIEDAVAGEASSLFLRGKGRGFCAGADLKERRTMAEADRHAHNRAINAAANALANAPMPTLAVLNGVAMGGGLELALACDMRIAAESALLGLTEARLGAIPGAGGTQRLPRLIGVSEALHMMFTGEPVSARRAHEIGLVNLCVPDALLEETVGHYIAVLGARSARTARILKRVVREGMAGTLSEGLECERQALQSILGSADYAEGLAAFAEKRPPRFMR